MKKLSSIQKLIPAVVLSVGAFGAVQAQEATEPMVVPSGNLTRAEVREDFVAWHQAGLSKAWQGEQTPDFTAPKYQEKRVAYQETTNQDETRLAGRGVHAQDQS